MRGTLPSYLSVILFLLIGLVTRVGAAAPVNDNFSSRIELTGAQLSITGDNRGATLEPGEHEFPTNMAKATVWYQWRAPVSGFVRIQVTAGIFPPAINVYRGKSVAALTAITNAVADWYSDTNVTCSFSVAAAETYIISVDSSLPGWCGPFTLGLDLTTFKLTSPVAGAAIRSESPPTFTVNQPLASVDGTIQSVAYFMSDGWHNILLGEVTNAPFALVPTNLPVGGVTVYAVGTNTSGIPRMTGPVAITVRPANDLFVHGLPLTGYHWETYGVTTQASREPGEPGSGAASVWWTWTAPASGRVRVWAYNPDMPGFSWQRTLAVYTGQTVNRLRRIPWAATYKWGQADFIATGGTTYHFQVTANDVGRNDRFGLVGDLDSLALVQRQILNSGPGMTFLSACRLANLRRRYKRWISKPGTSTAKSN